MADAAVTERRLRPIHDAISAQNWKQALKECEKWQKKGEKSDRFLALKAYVLVNQFDNGSIKKGETEVVQLCKRIPAVTDLEAIRTIQDALEDLSLESAGAELYERAAAANPADPVLLQTWLDTCIDDEKWQGAQKATMALRKAFPNDRKYDFWNVLLCFLVHEDQNVPEKERTMFGMLAYRMINKAAASIPTDQDSLLSPGKAVTTPEEVALLVQIYIKTGHAAEAVDLLSGSTLNQDSKVGGQDPQLVLSLLLEATIAAKQWDTAIQVCEALLEKSENRSDDRIWNTILEAHAHGETAGKERVQNLLQKHKTVADPPERSCLLAHLRLLKQDATVKQAELLDLCQTYHKTFGDRSFAFQDLRPFLAVLDQPNLNSYLDYVQQSDALPAAQLFRLKALRLDSDKGVTHGLELVTQALNIYRLSSNAGKGLAEAPILAALSLTHVALQTKSRTYMLRAVALLQLASGKHEAHFPFAVLLITLYRHLGLFSLAIATFVSLSIKNLQFETVAHHMFTRISTLHPHIPSTGHTESEDGSETIMEPEMAVDTALAVNNKIAEGLATSIKRGLQQNSYSNILDAIKTRQSIQSSMGKRMFKIEERQLARMTGADSSDDSIFALSSVPISMVDNRDYSFLSAYSTQDDDVWTQLACGPEPNERWLAIMTVHENLRTCLRRSMLYNDPDDWAPLHQAIKALEANSASHLGDTDKYLTKQESNLHQLVTCLIAILNKHTAGGVSTSDTESISPPAQAAADIGQILNQWLSTNPSPSHSTSITVGATWEQLHTYYTAFEAASLVLTFLNWVEFTEAAAGGRASDKSGPSSNSTNKKKSKPKPPTASGTSVSEDAGSGNKGKNPILPHPDSAAKLRTAATQLVERIKEQARLQKKALTEGGVLSSLVDVIVMGNTVDGGEEDGDDNDTDDNASDANKTTKQEFEKAYMAFLDQIGSGESSVEVVVGKWLASWEDALEGVTGVDVGRVGGVANGGGGDGVSGGGAGSRSGSGKVTGLFGNLLGKGSK